MGPMDKINTLSTFYAALEAAVAGVFAFRTEYDWVGVYLLEGDLLTLRKEHYIGLPTESDRIPITEGICGAAARERETIIVDDVRADPRYIACSITVRSEIVVPVISGKQVIGVLDIDSNTPAAFDESDHRYLEGVAAKLAGAWEREFADKSPG